jgi:hypothetical protein
MQTASTTERVSIYMRKNMLERWHKDSQNLLIHNQHGLHVVIAVIVLWQIYYAIADDESELQ